MAFRLRANYFKAKLSTLFYVVTRLWTSKPGGITCSDESCVVKAVVSNFGRISGIFTILLKISSS